MATVTQTKLMTAEELAKLTPDASRGELVRGEFIPKLPASYVHGKIGSKISYFLMDYLSPKGLYIGYVAGTGFILTKNPDTVRAPDVAFVSAEKANQQQNIDGFFDGAPDLAVEVISPSESAMDIEAKVLDYLQAGVALIWLVYPKTQTITVHQSTDNIVSLNIDDTLTGGKLLPDFSIPVCDIFK